MNRLGQFVMSLIVSGFFSTSCLWRFDLHHTITYVRQAQPSPLNSASR